MFGIEMETISLTLSVKFPWPSYWGSIPAIWLIAGGLTVIYSEVQVIATCSNRTIQARSNYSWWSVFIALSVVALCWPWALWVITKHWRNNTRANKRKAADWFDDL